MLNCFFIIIIFNVNKKNKKIVIILPFVSIRYILEYYHVMVLTMNLKLMTLYKELLRSVRVCKRHL